MSQTDYICQRARTQVLWITIFSILQGMDLTGMVSACSQERPLLSAEGKEHCPKPGPGFARPRAGRGPGDLQWLFPSGLLIQGLSAPPLSRAITPVAPPFTATGTRVTPQPRPEIGYQGSEPLPKPYPGPTGHSQAGLPGSLISLPGALSYLSFGSKRGGSQNGGAIATIVYLALGVRGG